MKFVDARGDPVKAGRHVWMGTVTCLELYCEDCYVLDACGELAFEVDE